METRDYLSYIVNEIHTVIVATVDKDGLPVTVAIDMMDSDDNSLYFLTAKGKNFYDRLKDKNFLAFTAMKGEDTMSRVTVSIRGKVKEEKIEETFKNKDCTKKKKIENKKGPFEKLGAWLDDKLGLK